MSYAAHILPKINAPHGVALSASQMAVFISDPVAMQANGAVGHVFSFLTEIPLQQQQGFIAEQGVPVEKAVATAQMFAGQCANPIPLAG